MAEATQEQTGDQKQAGSEAKTETKAPDLTKEVETLRQERQGMDRTVSEFQEGKRVPKWLEERGIRTIEELDNRLVPDQSKGNGGGQATVAVPRAESGKPIRPRRSEFLDADTGLVREAEYDEAMDAYERADETWRSDSDAESAESRAIQEVVDSAPAHLVQGEGGKEALADILGVLAWKEAGEKIARPEHVKAAFQKYQSYIEESVKARLAAVEEQAKKNAKGEAKDLGNLQAAAVSVKTDKPPTLLERNQAILQARHQK